MKVHDTIDENIPDACDTPTAFCRSETALFNLGYMFLVSLIRSSARRKRQTAPQRSQVSCPLVFPLTQTQG
jgi:hypothetical protein